MPGLFLHIGTISKAHGIKGEVSVDYYADSRDLLYGPLFFQGNSGGRESCRVENARKDHGRMLIRFAGIEDRNAAEKLRGLRLMVPEDVLPLPAEDELYIHELLNMRVTVLHVN